LAALIGLSLSSPPGLSDLPALPDRKASADRRIVVVTPDERDGRYIALHEAIAFWNRTLAELDVPTRLVEDRVLVAPPMTRALENYTRAVWQLAGKTIPRGAGPRAPRELSELKGDLVVFFSRQVLFSFARPFDERARFFVGIQTDTAPPLTFPNISRNVIAHELGHALGLQHNGDTPTLMCGPCQHLLYQSDEPKFFPITPEERARLRVLHE
jgi:hypothetical protein